MPNISPLDKIANVPGFKPFMKKLSVFALVLIMVGAVLKLSGVHAGNSILITGMGTLIVVSFFLGRLFSCPYHTGVSLWKFALTLTGYSLAAALGGLLYIIMHWPGGKLFLIIGAGCLAISAIAWLFFFIPRNKQ